MTKQWKIVLGCLVAWVAAQPVALTQERAIKIGVQLALTGDLAQSGTDQRNAITLAQDELGAAGYQLIVEDDKCSNKEALSIAQKFISEGVKYVLGMTCNQTLISTAPVYEKAGVFVLSSGGTSGDIHSLGKDNFRIFPSDMFGAFRLFDFVKNRHKHIAVITEMTEYATMMERSFVKANDKAGRPLRLSTHSFVHTDTDLRTLLLKIVSTKPDAIYINADSDTSFITLLRQLSALQFAKPRYTVYLGASASVLKEVPQLAEGLIFSNLPTVDKLLSDQGRKLFEKFRARFGEPLSGFPTAAPAMESLRILHLALSAKVHPTQYLHSRKFEDGYLPPYYFDDGGNVQGFQFEMQEVKGGKVVILE